MGGRLFLFVKAWEKVTSDPFIISDVGHGFRMSVSRFVIPTLSSILPTLSAQDWAIIQDLQDA